jgi:hypothetical protein
MFFLNGCAPDPHNKFIDFVITTTYSVKDSIEYIALTSEFKFTRDVNFIFDHDALSLESYTTEDEKIVNIPNDLFAIIDSIRRPQFIIENQKSEKRFFSEIKFFDGEKISPKCVFKLERTLDTLRLRKNQSAKVKSIVIDVNRLKINEGDSTIRLYYVYKPTEEEKAIGFSPICFKSDWVNLYKK